MVFWPKRQFGTGLAVSLGLLLCGMAVSIGLALFLDHRNQVQTELEYQRVQQRLADEIERRLTHPCVLAITQSAQRIGGQAVPITN